MRRSDLHKQTRDLGLLGSKCETQNGTSEGKNVRGKIEKALNLKQFGHYCEGNVHDGIRWESHKHPSGRREGGRKENGGWKPSRLATDLAKGRAAVAWGWREVDGFESGVKSTRLRD